MKTVALVLVAGASLAACASGGRMELVEQGYDRGELAVAAIDRGDWSRAEQALLRNEESNDPARLINLGRVYMETGRPSQAIHVWQLAAASNRHFDVETGDGRVVSSKQLAQELLRRYERSNVTARLD